MSRENNKMETINVWSFNWNAYAIGKEANKKRFGGAESQLLLFSRLFRGKQTTEEWGSIQ